MTGNNKIESVIFDLGNVLIDFDHRLAARRISGFADKSGEEIFALFFDSELTALFEAGKISPLQFFLKVKEILKLRLDYGQFVPIWNEIFFFSQKNLDVYNLASALSGHYKITLLSNINVLHFEYIKKTFPVLDIFHNIITSFELGLRKPQSQIYEKALEITATFPNKTFYTDDRPELVASARKLGIQAFVFTGPDQLKKDLSAVSIQV